MFNHTGEVSTSKKFFKKIIKQIAKLLVNLLVNVETVGLENFPEKGPYIVVGNHVSAMEAILMMIVTPLPIEFLGTGDIPIDPRMSFFANLYGFIPIMRGQIDQKGLRAAIRILEQDGVLGIFPEGGIWEKSLKEPKLGVSWISFKSRAKVIPIGFIGMNGALKKALSFTKPKVIINVGKPLTFNDIFPETNSLKESMKAGANFIMGKIANLLPENEITNSDLNKQKKISYYFLNEGGQTILISFKNQEAFSKLIEHPIIMDVFKRNLKLPVNCLLKRSKNISLKDTKQALLAIRGYLELNPGFLSYRFGIEEGIMMKDGQENFLNILSENETNYPNILISYSEVEITEFPAT